MNETAAVFSDVFGSPVLSLKLIIYLVVYTKVLQDFGSLAIGDVVGLNIFFLVFISGAPMNPERSLAPALLSGVLGNLWLYWTATFIGSVAVASLVRRKFKSQEEIALVLPIKYGNCGLLQA